MFFCLRNPKLPSKFRVIYQPKGFYPKPFWYMEMMRLSPNAVFVLKVIVLRRLIEKWPILIPSMRILKNVLDLIVFLRQNLVHG